MSARRRITTDVGPFAIVPDWIVETLTATQRGVGVQVWCRLWHYANWTTLECWPSHSTLADDLSCSVDSVRRAIRALERIGAVDRLGQIDGRGAQRYLLRTVPPAPIEDHR